MSADDYPGVEAHGPIEPVIPEVYLVTGSVVMMPLVRIPRNMIIVRHGDELSLINAVRLSPAGEAELAKLGKVAHVIRIGVHGMDDRYYVERLGAKLWGFAKARHAGGLEPDVALEPGVELPFPDAELFVFEQTKAPEAAVLLTREGGLLVTCDSVQNWEDTAGCSVLGALATRAMGFLEPAQIGPPWRKMMTPEGGSLRPDFERLAALEFRHLVGGHGRPLMDHARERLAETLTRVYG